MGKQKINYRIILILILGLTSCKKLKEEKYGVKIRAYIPILNSGVNGITYQIVQVKNKFSWAGEYFQKFEKELIKTGTLLNSTDFQMIEFMGKKNKGKYDYYISFDFSALGDNYFVNAEAIGIGGGMLSHAYGTEENTFDILISKKLSNFKIHYFNANCFDETDEFKYKQISTHYKDEIKDLENIPWTISSNLQGCADYNTQGGNNETGISIYKWEAKRNNIITSGIDTFYKTHDNQTIEVVW